MVAALSDATPLRMNRSFAQIRIALYAIAVTFALAGAARAQQALPGLGDAQVAVDRATQADADQYAPAELAAARQSLAQAQAAHAAREKKAALDLALRAAVDADLARARSQEAVATAEVAQRKAEIADLQAQIGAEGRR